MADRTCGNCKHWDTEFEDIRPAIGECFLANEMYQHGAARHPASFAVVGDGSLKTTDSHYCNEHEFIGA